MDKGFFETYFDFSGINADSFFIATKETLYMTFVSMFFVILIGLGIGLLLFYCGKSQKKTSRFGYGLISLISNTFRSIPFIILMILLFPLVKALLGTMLGPSAAIPALVLSAAPFYGRLVDIAFREVDQGVLEASEAMGASRLQIIIKVLIPESLPALISGITVTTITMIGFTAMAGAVGAGGLGTLAYQAGFMGNDYSIIMLATLLILLFVFTIQWLGDVLVQLVDKRVSGGKDSKKQLVIGFGAIVAVTIGLLVFFNSHETPKEVSTTSSDKVIVVGASPTPHAEILEQAKPLLAEKGYDLKIKVFQDFVLPNTALAENEIDANYFQHIPYLEKEIVDKGYDFANAGSIHLEKMAFYSKTVSNVDDVKEGATVLVSNSQSDWGRVITILQDAELVKVKDGVELSKATFDDIEENPKNLRFKYDVAPEILTTAYQNNEADLIAINANFAENIGLNPEKDGVFVEKGNSPYANVIATRTEDKESEKIKALIEVLRSDEIRDFVDQKWNGTISIVE